MTEFCHFHLLSQAVKFGRYKTVALLLPSRRMKLYATVFAIGFDGRLVFEFRTAEKRANEDGR